MIKQYVPHIVQDGTRFHVTSYHGMSNGNSYIRCSEPNCIENKHYDELKENGFASQMPSPDSIILAK